MRKAFQSSGLRGTNASGDLAQSGSRASFPAWGLSLLLHAGLILALTFTLRWEPKGNAAQTVRSVDVVLKHRSDEGDYYESSEDVAEALAADQGQIGGDSIVPGDTLDDPPPSDPTDVLPELDESLGPGSISDSLLSGAGEMTGGPQQPRLPTQGTARTEVFGVAGEGYKFVYVFDRSGSMGGSGRSPLDAAKEELLGLLLDTLAEERKKYTELMQNPELIEDTLQKGADKVRPIAQAVLSRIREALGF